jgi:hypothetical protein
LLQTISTEKFYGFDNTKQNVEEFVKAHQHWGGKTPGEEGRNRVDQ